MSLSPKDELFAQLRGEGMEQQEPEPAAFHVENWYPVREVSYRRR